MRIKQIEDKNINYKSLKIMFIIVLKIMNLSNEFLCKVNDFKAQ